MTKSEKYVQDRRKNRFGGNGETRNFLKLLTESDIIVPRNTEKKWCN